MGEKSFFKGLVSPKTGTSLYEVNGELTTSDGREHFVIKDGIANLIDSTIRLDNAKQHEKEVFDNIDIKYTSYFNKSLFEDVTRIINVCLKEGFCSGGKKLVVAEMGGGEGHFARFVHKEITGATVFVCDLSYKTLERAPDSLRRVCADVTHPIFESCSVDLVSFWVSLHHLEVKLQRKTLEEVVRILDKDGILVVFEPNSEFWLRQIMYRSYYSQDVYVDESEQALNFTDLFATAEDLGLVKVGSYFLNPPYNPAFVKKLKRWVIYLPVVKLLYLLDKWVLWLFWGRQFSNKQWSLKKYFTLYGLAVYKKVDN